jgi:hypothetical protein
MRLASEGGFAGAALAVGSRTGENALLVAALELPVLGGGRRLRGYWQSPGKRLATEVRG